MICLLLLEKRPIEEVDLSIRIARMRVGNTTETIMMLFRDLPVEDFEVQILKLEPLPLTHARSTLVGLAVMSINRT
jgi:hypothetical protein